MTLKKYHFLFLLPLTILLANCSDKKETTSSSASFTNIYNNTLSQSCVGCHAPGGSVYDTDGVLLDFTNATTSYNTLTSLNASGPTSGGACTSIPIVGSSASTSFLAAVLFDDYNSVDFAGVSGCTPYNVHLSDQNLSASEKSEIINWINAGAPNN